MSGVVEISGNSLIKEAGTQTEGQLMQRQGGMRQQVAPDPSVPQGLMERCRAVLLVTSHGPLHVLHRVCVSAKGPGECLYGLEGALSGAPLKIQRAQGFSM